METWRAFTAWLGKLDASALAAWVALVISVLNVCFSVIGVWWRGKAGPAAQLDLLSFQNQSGWHEDERVVVTNQGPHVMKKVNVEVFDEDAKLLTATDPNLKALWPGMPFAYLYIGQSLYLKLNTSQATQPARTAEITWKDGRWRQQSQRIGLSYNRVS